MRCTYKLVKRSVSGLDIKESVALLFNDYVIGCRLLSITPTRQGFIQIIDGVLKTQRKVN